MRVHHPRGCCRNPGICLIHSQDRISLKGLSRATHSTDRAQISGNVIPTVELCPNHLTFGINVQSRRDVPEEKNGQLRGGEKSSSDTSRGRPTKTFRDLTPISRQNTQLRASRQGERGRPDTFPFPKRHTKSYIKLSGMKRARVRAVLVGSGKCDPVGNGSGRERESRVSFVPERNFPTYLIAGTVYRPDLRYFVPVPTVSPPAMRCVPDFFRPAVRPVVPMPSRRSHQISPIPQLSSVADVPIPFTMGCIFSTSYDYTDATGLFQF